MICESVVKPEAFDYAKGKGLGRPKTSRTAVFKAFLFKAQCDIPTTKELARRLRHDVQARRLCGWNSAGDVPSEGQFSVVNKEFSERGFAEKWFDGYVRTYVEGDLCATVSYDSAPISVRAKAENARRMLEEFDPDQPVPPSRLEWQAGKDADAALAELPQNCDWGEKRDSHGKPKHWKGGKIHAAVTRDGIPVAVAYTSASARLAGHDSAREEGVGAHGARIRPRRRGLRRQDHSQGVRRRRQRARDRRQQPTRRTAPHDGHGTGGLQRPRHGRAILQPSA